MRIRIRIRIRNPIFDFDANLNPFDFDADPPMTRILADPDPLFTEGIHAGTCPTVHITFNQSFVSALGFNTDGDIP